MARDQRHLHDPAAAEKFARALGLMVGGHHPFVGDWQVKGLYAYRYGKYKGQAYFGTGGVRARLKDTHDPNKPGESNQKYRPWNRDDPKIPEDIRQKLIRLEERMNANPRQTPHQKTCFGKTYPRFGALIIKNTTGFIQFKPVKSMENHGTKIIQGVCCISTMRIRGRSLMEFG